jgi:hypothetical protein
MIHTHAYITYCTSLQNEGYHEGYEEILIKFKFAAAERYLMYVMHVASSGSDYTPPQKKKMF